MNLYRTCYWVLAFFPALVPRIAVQCTHMRYKAIHNCKIKDGYYLEHNTADSLVACVIKCTINARCISVAWKSDLGLCMLSAVDTIFEVEVEMARSYEEATGWLCASLILWPVFRALDSTYSTQRYEMTFDRASARCTELNTTLADPEDLTTAQSLGLSYCQCGWMSDWTNALILHSYSPSCISYYQPGPILCGRSLADAWCRIPQF